jgi:type VI secretion system secreted protein Hcp
VLDLSSYRLGATNSATTATGAGGGAGKVSFDAVSVTTTTDAARPTLLRLVAEGQHVQSALLQTLDRTGGTVTATYLLEDVVLSGEAAADNGSSDGRALDTLTLGFSKVTVQAGGASYCFDVVRTRAAEALIGGRAARSGGPPSPETSASRRSAA